MENTLGAKDLFVIDDKMQNSTDHPKIAVVNYLVTGTDLNLVTEIKIKNAFSITYLQIKK